MKKIIALILAFGMIFCLCACGGNTTEKSESNTKTESSEPANTAPETTSKDEAATKFTLTVVDQNGDPVPNAVVQVCKGDLCIPGATDANGVAQFNFEATDGHEMSLNTCPDGYETEYVGDNKLELEDGISEFTFEITKK